MPHYSRKYLQTEFNMVIYQILHDDQDIDFIKNVHMDMEYRRL